MILDSLIDEMHMSIDRRGVYKIAVHKLARLLGLPHDYSFSRRFDAAFGQLAGEHGWEHDYENWGFFVEFRNRS